MRRADPMAAKALEIVDEELKRQENKVIHGIMKKFDAGEPVSNEEAVQAWARIWSLRSLESGLKSQVTRANMDQTRRAKIDE